MALVPRSGRPLAMASRMGHMAPLARIHQHIALPRAWSRAPSDRWGGPTLRVRPARAPLASRKDVSDCDSSHQHCPEQRGAPGAAGDASLLRASGGGCGKSAAAAGMPSPGPSSRQAAAAAVAAAAAAAAATTAAEIAPDAAASISREPDAAGTAAAAPAAPAAAAAAMPVGMPFGRPAAIIAAAAVDPSPDDGGEDEADEEGFEDEFEGEDEEGRQLVGDGGEGLEGEEEEEEEEPGFGLAAGEGGADGGEPAPYPEPPVRGYYLPDLLAKADEEALCAQAARRRAAHDARVHGFSGDPATLVEGDVFVCSAGFDLARGPIDRHAMVAAAADAGASVILAAAHERPIVEQLLLARAAERASGGSDANAADAAGDDYGEYDEGYEDEGAYDEDKEAEEAEYAGDEGEPGPRAAAAAAAGDDDALAPGAPGVRVVGGVPVVFVADVDTVAAKLAAAFYDGPSLDMRVVAVAGTSGKTTVAWLVRGILEEAGVLTGMAGTVEYALAEDRLDADGELWQPTEDDPAAKRECAVPFHLAPFKGRYAVDYGSDIDGVRAQKLLAGMRDRGATAAVVEASAEALARGWLEFVDVDVAVWTNFGDDARHAALHGGSAEACLASQLALLEALDDPERQRAIVNLDDPMAARARAAASRVPVLTYSLTDPCADVSAESLQLTPWETELIVRVPGGRRLQVIAPLVGRHNASNVLAAVTAGVALGAPLEAVVAGVEAAAVVPGRSEVVNADPDDPVLRGDFPVVVDAADSPARVAAVLEGLREAGVEGRVIAVVSADGETAPRGMRTRLGAAAFERADVVVVTNGSPRREPPEDVVADVMDGLPERVRQAYAGYVYAPFQDQGRVPLWFEPWLHSAQRTHKRHVIEDRFSAIRAAIGTARPGDAVAILGRGHLDFVEHWDGDESAPGLKRGWLDDRVEARNALSKLEYLYSLTGLSRADLPWGHAAADADRSAIWEEPPLFDGAVGTAGGGGGGGGGGGE